MEWVNVNDKLPYYGEPVLVWTTSGMCIAHRCGETITGSQPTWFESNGEHEFWNVLCWMPLPEPPENI